MLPVLQMKQSATVGVHDRGDNQTPAFFSRMDQPPIDELPEGWDAATRYHRLKRTLPERYRRVVHDRAVDAIMEKARELLRHAARPTHSVADAFPAPGELDLDATLDTPRPWQASDLVVRRNEPREADIVAILDMSLSMTGPKIALIALASAILRLRFERVGVVAFDTVAHTIVGMTEDVDTHELVKRILAVPAQGYTNIQAGLDAGLNQLRRSHRRVRAGIIMTDGIANMGKDPVAVAAHYPLLHVVQVGEAEKQGTETCERMARSGRGLRYRASSYEQLPTIVRRLIRECFGL